MRIRILCAAFAVLLVGCAATPPAVPPVSTASATTAVPVTVAPPETTAAPTPATVAPSETTAVPETTARPAPQTTRPPETTASPMLTSTYRADVEAAWKALGDVGFDAHQRWPIDLVCAMLEGNGAEMASALGVVPTTVYACYDGMEISGWRLDAESVTYSTRSIPPQTWTVNVPVLTLTIASGGSEVLGVGTHRLVFEEGVVRRLLPYAAEAVAAPTEYGAAEAYVCDYIGVYYDNETFIANRLGAITGSFGPYSAEDILAYAADHLGLSPAAIDFTRLSPYEGGYIAIGRGSASPQFDFAETVERDGVTVVTVQYWADYSRTVRSKTVEYHLTRGPRDYILVAAVTLEDSGLPTASYAI